LFECRYKQIVGLADLKYSSSNVINMQKKFLDTIIELGFNGLRFDGAKHMEPVWLHTLTVYFYDKMFEKYKDTNSQEYQNILIIYEIITSMDSMDVTKFYWTTAEFFSFDAIRKTSNIRSYDFPFHNDINNVLNYSLSLQDFVNKWTYFNSFHDFVIKPKFGDKSNGYDQFIPPNRSISFIDNHDTIQNSNNNASNFRKNIAYALSLFIYDAVPLVLDDSNRPNATTSFYRERDNEELIKLLALYRRLTNKNVKVLFADNDIAIIQLSNTAVMYVNRSGSAYTLTPTFPNNYLQKADLETGYYWNVFSTDTLTIYNNTSNPHVNESDNFLLRASFIYIFAKPTTDQPPPVVPPTTQDPIIYDNLIVTGSITIKQKT